MIRHAGLALPCCPRKLIERDKVCNVRDIALSPPTDWALERRRDYLTWSEQVVAGCRGVNPKLDRAFDEAIGQARKGLSP